MSYTREVSGLVCQHYHKLFLFPTMHGLHVRVITVTCNPCMWGTGWRTRTVYVFILCKLVVVYSLTRVHMHTKGQVIGSIILSVVCLLSAQKSPDLEFWTSDLEWLVSSMKMSKTKKKKKKMGCQLFA